MNLIVTGALGHIGTFLLSNFHLMKKVNNIYAIDKLDEKMLNLINLKLKKKNKFYKSRSKQKKIKTKN